MSSQLDFRRLSTKNRLELHGLGRLAAELGELDRFVNDVMTPADQAIALEARLAASMSTFADNNPLCKPDNGRNRARSGCERRNQVYFGTQRPICGD